MKSSVQPHFGFYNPGLSSYDPIFGLQDRNKVLQSFVQTSPKLQARSSPRPVSKTTCCSAPNPHSSYWGLTFASFDHARRTRLEQIEVMLLSAASDGAPPICWRPVDSSSPPSGSPRTGTLSTYNFTASSLCSPKSLMALPASTDVLRML